MGRLFGTDGVRGVVGDDLTADLARSLGSAAAMALAGQGDARPTFVIGRDTRASGEMLEEAVSEGICAAGGNVLLAGIIPTPGVAFLATEMGAAGLVISASHNPAEYNGIKIFAPTGHKLPDSVEDEIEDLMSSDEMRAGEPGGVDVLADARERYLRHLTDSGDRLDGLRLVVDCANGAASGVAPEAYRRLGAEVVAINDMPDGENINSNCGALHPEVVGAEVAKGGADAGVAHDGDADRALFCDAAGNLVDGDHVLVACAVDLKRRGLLKDDTVVTTVMANIGFRRAMADAGISVRTTKVGDRYVLEEMMLCGSVLGGEQSGHVIFADRATTGDGLLTAIRFLSLAGRTGASVADLGAQMRRFPQVLENVDVADLDALGAAASVWEAVDRVERILGESGRVLVRTSGTEPLVRVMVEAETEEQACAHARDIAEQVRRALGPA
jgi:phosphoglucosamine mutase